LLVAVLGCDAFITIHGRVVDANMNPIAGATVKVLHASEPDVYTTDENGRFSYFDHTSPIGSDTVRISIMKEGYESIESDEIDSRQIPLPKTNARHDVEFIFKMRRSGGGDTTH
jgi:hypothetical protein